LEDFDDSSLRVALYCWIGHAKDDLRIGSELRFAIHRAFVQKGIEIPFPQRELRQRGST
jgi:small-conductance mechanosensitive channel